IRELKQRSKARNDQLITKRIDDLEFYIEYLYLLNQFQSDKTEENTNLLLDKIMTEEGNRLLHPYGLFRVLQRETKISRPIALSQNVPIETIEIESPISLRRNIPVSFHPVNPEFYLDSVNTFTPIP